MRKNRFIYTLFVVFCIVRVSYTQVYFKPSTELEFLIIDGKIDELRAKLRSNYGFGNTQFTPLYYACMYNKMDIVKMLVEEFKVDIDKGVRNITEIKYMTRPLNIALFNKNTAIAKYLIEKGANVKEYSREDTMAPLWDALDDINYEIVKMMVERGASIDLLDFAGDSPLFFTLSRPQCFNLMKYFLEQGADIKHLNKFEVNALHVVSASNNIEAFDYLYGKYKKIILAMLTKYNQLGEQALHAACANRAVEMIQKILELGAGVNVRQIKTENRFSDNNVGYTPAMVVLRDSYGDDYSTVAKALRILIDAGADCTTMKDDVEGMTVFLMAAYQHYTSEPLALMLKLGKFDFKNKDNNGVGAMGFAARSNVENVKLLVSYGANINEMYGKEKITPLYLAIKYGNVEAVRYLLSLKALQLDAPSGATWDYRNYATAMGNEEIKKLIVAAFEQRQK